MSEIVFVSAVLVALPGRAEAVKAAIRDVIPPTCEEEGCVRYVAHQCTTDANRFLFFEEWTSQADLDAHLRSPHLTGFVETVGNLLSAQPEVHVWKAL